METTMKLKIIALGLIVLILPLQTQAVYGLTKSLDIESTSNQTASRADSALLSITGNLTLECWVKPESIVDGETYVIAGKFVSTDDNRSYRFALVNIAGVKKLRSNITNTGSNVGGGQVDSSSVTINTATWYHTAMVYTASGGSTRFVLDGVDVNTGTGQPTSIYDSTAIFEIGGADAGSYFDGGVSLCRVWNTARTTAQINDNKCNVFGTAQTGLVAEWSLDNVYTDASGNGLTLTGNNTPVFATDVPAICENGGGAGGSATTTTATSTAMQAETFATVLFVSGFAILFYIMVYTVKRFTRRR